jgi:hypothetical protein
LRKGYAGVNVLEGGIGQCGETGFVSYEAPHNAEGVETGATHSTFSELV